jgi:hypothetical protein
MSFLKYKKSAPSPPLGRRCTTQTKQTIVYLHRQMNPSRPFFATTRKMVRGNGFLGK